MEINNNNFLYSSLHLIITAKTIKYGCTYRDKHIRDRK